MPPAPPITSIVANIVGDRADITGIVPEGTNSHTFEPPPSVAATLADSDIVFVNGLGLEGWFDRLIRASGTRAPVVVASAGVKPIPAQDEHAHGDGDHGHGEALAKLGQRNRLHGAHAATSVIAAFRGRL